ncbi:MAG: RNA polymerase sigma-54 factor [Deltaproteobacteria bacterium HGW-Deltaproteobacteria-22]|jgi:RNA polymerase sigma-54 factor|nr:MAG: RNA polymerase sigma-54 factor [Deltaproteobacteria bacterium HGW-Deltaproteobacteria-22]
MICWLLRLEKPQASLMGFDLKQQLNITQRLEHRLVMTQQMQQAISMLQLSHLELIEQINEELLENPILQEADDASGDDAEGRDSMELPAVGDADDPVAQPDDDVRLESERLEGEASGVDDLLPEVPSSESLSLEQENSLREDVEWNAYVADSVNYTPDQGMYDPSALEEWVPPENRLSSKPTLAEHLLWQMQVSDFHSHERAAAEFIIGNLNADGYLTSITVEEIAQKTNLLVETVERTLAKIQQFDPVGVGARSLVECLLIQAQHYGTVDPVMETILARHLRELERKDYGTIARALKIPVEDVLETVKAILVLDPHPGRAYGSEDVNYIVPDVYIYRQGDDYQVTLNDDGMPRLRLSQKFINTHDQAAVKEYIEQKKRHAKWLIQAIQMRQETILRVTRSILKFQHDFFDFGPSRLRPLTLREVAQDVERHESTVSRVTTNKYAHTPHGLFELKYFFRNAVTRTDGDDIASEVVRSKIRTLVEAENPKKPMSDQEIVAALAREGIEIARRTVQKYREQLGILNSSQRKRFF